MKYVNKLTYIFLSVVFTSILFIYFYSKNLDEKIRSNIEKVFIKNTSQIAKNIESFILNKTNTADLFSTLRSNPYLRKDIEDSISLLTSTLYKYIFVAYRDKKGRYRYLLDGSKEDRGEFGQKIDVDKKLWNKVYALKQDTIIHHNSYQGIWLTYLHPILIDNQTQALIAIDFSTSFPLNLAKSLQPIKTTIELVFFAIVLLLFVLFYQIYFGIKAKKASFLDPLTNLFNRAFLREFLKHNSLENYAIIMADIDHFKQINDSWGHKAGDYALQEVAKLLKQNLRDDDIIIRYGGEEFLILLHKSQEFDEAQARKIAERIRKLIETSTFTHEGQKLKFTISMGLLFDPLHFRSPMEAIKNADKLLYVAKKEGRNKVVTKMSSRFTNSLDIDEVQAAIDDRRLVCLFQPIFECKTLQKAKYEALVRIKNKDGSLVTPDKFLNNIAFTSTYMAMTNSVLEIVFDKIRQKGYSVSINLSFSDIMDNKIFYEITKQIEKHKKLAQNLTIELLENEAYIDKKILSQKLDRLKSFGVKIAIDDFGSGYANFDLLRCLPFDYIKIDGALIKEITTDHKSFHIVKSIAALAHDLSIETVGEFVENKAILDMLIALNVTYAQGFYLAKPSSL